MIIFIALINVFNKAPRLKEFKGEKSDYKTSITIIIPAYNEELKIKRCILSLIQSIPPCNEWNLLFVDDCSTDKTLEIVHGLKSSLNISDGFLKIVSAGPRPKEERWVGKNWACSQAMQYVNSSWVLFVDADVELQKNTLRRSLSQAIEEDIDLLSLAPKIMCSCLSEWMVQPIIAMLLAIGFPISETNNPATDVAFAAGPYMLFKKSSYDEIGGHKNIPSEVVEDIKLAKLIKEKGFKLQFLLGLDSIKLKMYSNFSELWEGWTKNWFLGLKQNIFKSISASFVVLIIFFIPWFILISNLIFSLVLNGNLQITTSSYFLSFLAIFMQFILRVWCNKKFNLPTKNWPLMSLGGIIIFFIGMSSIWKTKTGQGWTWKGRDIS